MDLRLEANQLASQAKLFGIFTGITKPTPSDRFFLVMGRTGSGKSTFISRCTGKEVTVGHGLYSCTGSIDIFDYQSTRHRVYLIDTPGFNDTTRSEIDTLSLLATYLGTSYAHGVRIHGIILLHPISDNRMSGSSLRHREMLEAMCGFASYRTLVIATTMWPESPDPRETAFLENRDRELQSDPRFFGELVDRGATILRHNSHGRRHIVEEKASARRVVEHLLSEAERRPPTALQLQQEMIDEGMALGETKVGIVVAGELHAIRRAHELELQRLERSLRVDRVKKDEEHTAELNALRADLEAKLMNGNRDKQMLQQSIDGINRREEKAMKRRMRDIAKRFDEGIATKDDEVICMEESIQEIKKDVLRREAQYPGEQTHIEHRIDRHQKELAIARREVLETRDAFNKFERRFRKLVTLLKTSPESP